jgi:hypothetical protein
MDKGRIPTRLGPFNVHLSNVNTYLHKIEQGTTQMRGEILGMTTEELLKLSTFYNIWTSEDPQHPGIWDLHSFALTKTKATRQDVVTFMKNFGKFFRPVLNRISGNTNITEKDYINLRIALPVSKRSRPTTNIKETCYINAQTLGSGRLKISCYYDEHPRSAKPPRADAVEIAYLLDLPYKESEDKKNTNAFAMFDPEKYGTRVISTKASFTLELGGDKMGQRMQYYGRWINTKYPRFSGNWSVLYKKFVS